MLFIYTGLQSGLYAKDPVAKLKIYRFGVVPQFEQRKIFRIWVPIIERLEKDTGLRFELVGSDQIPTFETRFLAGEFDFAYMNPYHVLRANNKQGYIPLVRDGIRKLQGIIVVRKDSAIKEVNDLKSVVVAFPSARALGASLLPRSELKKIDIIVNPRYVKTHSSVYLHVAQKLAVAGGGVQSTLNHQKPEVRNLLRVVFRTQSYTPHPIVAHPRVTKQDIIKVREAFLKMGQTEDGRALLAKIPMKSIAPAKLRHYNAVKRLKLERLQ